MGRMGDHERGQPSTGSRRLSTFGARTELSLSDTRPLTLGARSNAVFQSPFFQKRSDPSGPSIVFEGQKVLRCGTALRHRAQARTTLPT